MYTIYTRMYKKIQIQNTCEQAPWATAAPRRRVAVTILMGIMMMNKMMMMMRMSKMMLMMMEMMIVIMRMRMMPIAIIGRKTNATIRVKQKKVGVGCFVTKF